MGERASLSGRVVGHFEMLERLGAGGFGEVYRARDTKLDRTVAVKVLPKSVAVDPRAPRRGSGARPSPPSALNHPNICTVHDPRPGPRRALPSSSWSSSRERRSTRALLKRGPMPLADAPLLVALQVAEGSSEAHRAGHPPPRRQVPEHRPLSRRGQAKVLDFGLAKLMGADLAGEAETLEKLTAEGILGGDSRLHVPRADPRQVRSTDGATSSRSGSSSTGW